MARQVVTCSTSQVVAAIVGQMVAERGLAHEKTVCSPFHHCLVVIKQRVKRP